MRHGLSVMVVAQNLQSKTTVDSNNFGFKLYDSLLRFALLATHFEMAAASFYIALFSLFSTIRQLACFFNFRTAIIGSRLESANLTLKIRVSSELGSCDYKEDSLQTVQNFLKSSRIFLWTLLGVLLEITSSTPLQVDCRKVAASASN